MYLSQRISYPVADHERLRVTKNILCGEYFMRCICHKECPMTDHIRMHVTKNILLEGSREYTRHKENPILWQTI